MITRVLRREKEGYDVVIPTSGHLVYCVEGGRFQGEVKTGEHNFSLWDTHPSFYPYSNMKLDWALESDRNLGDAEVPDRLIGKFETVHKMVVLPAQENRKKRYNEICAEQKRVESEVEVARKQKRADDGLSVLVYSTSLSTASLRLTVLNMESIGLPLVEQRACQPFYEVVKEIHDCLKKQIKE